MTTISFDSLGYFEKLKKAGVPEEQAKVQVEVMQSVVKNYDEASRSELATKGDIQDVRNEIQEVHNEIQEVRNEISNTRNEILKWTMGMMIAQSTIMITAFGIGIAILK